VTEGALRSGWALAVLGAGAVLVRGLALTSYFELTPQAQADAQQGRRLLWAATTVLLVATASATWRWRASVWSLACVALAGPVGLLADHLGWIPLVALVVSAPLLLIGLTGVLLAPRRPGPIGVEERV